MNKYGKIGRLILSLVVVGLGVLTILFAVVLPLYVDEVVTRVFFSRLFSDEGVMMTLFPQCGLTLHRLVSPLHYPAVLVLSAIYEPLGPLGVRITGIVVGLIFVAMLGIFYRNLVKGKKYWFNDYAFLMSLCFLGVLPFQFAMVRVEQILLCSVLFYLIILDSEVLRDRFKTVFFANILVLSAFSYSHPKIIFFVPFIVYSLSMYFEKRRWMLAGMLVYLGLLIITVGLSMRLFYSCKDAPEVVKIMSALSLDPKLLFLDPGQFIEVGLGNLGRAVGSIVSHIYFSPSYQSGWLVGHELPSGILFESVNSLIKPLLSGLIYFANIFPFLYVGYSVVMRKQISKHGWAALLLATSNVGNFVLYSSWAFYGGPQIVAISVLIAGLVLPELRKEIGLLSKSCGWKSYSYKGANAFNLFASAVIALSLLSMSFLLWIYAQPSFKNMHSGGAALLGQPFSVPTLGVKDRLSDISRLADKCGFRRDEVLVVDSFTYFALKDFQHPIHALYVGRYYGQDLDGKLARFLRMRYSRGGVTQCDWVPMELRKFVRDEEAGYCCFVLD